MKTARSPAKSALRAKLDVMNIPTLALGPAQALELQLDSWPHRAREAWKALSGQASSRQQLGMDQELKETLAIVEGLGGQALGWILGELLERRPEIEAFEYKLDIGAPSAALTRLKVDGRWIMAPHHPLGAQVVDALWALWNVGVQALDAGVGINFERKPGQSAAESCLGAVPEAWARMTEEQRAGWEGLWLDMSAREPAPDQAARARGPRI